MESKNSDTEGAPLIPTTPGNEFPSQLRRAIAVVLVAALSFVEGVSMSLPGPFFPPRATDHGKKLCFLKRLICNLNFCIHFIQNA